MLRSFTNIGHTLVSSSTDAICNRHVGPHDNAPSNATANIVDPFVVAVPLSVLVFSRTTTLDDCNTEQSPMFKQVTAQLFVNLSG